MSRPPASREVSRLRQEARPHSPSRSRSRPRDSRHTTASSIPLLPQGPEYLIAPGGAIGEEAAELLHEFVHPHHHQPEETLAGEDGPPGIAAEVEEEEEDFKYDILWRKKLPWWKRPSAWWFLSYVPFSAIAMTITAAAKIELYTYLACAAHKPELNPDRNTTFLIAQPSQRACHADPAVSAAVAELNILLTTTMGILTCMTTAWWGSLSDRYGRTRVLGCSVIGVVMTDFVLIMVYYFSEQLPGGYKFLIVGPVVEGVLGGLSSMSANVHAYMSDCTSPASRSKIFSRYLGLLFTGMAVGPVLGGLVIRFSGSFISVFFIAAGLHLVYALLVWFVIPESLSKHEMQAARIRQKTEEDEYRAAHAHGGLLVFFKRLFSFLTPLLLFLPVQLNTAATPAKGKKRDWSLLLVVIAYGFTISLMGSYVYFMQYIQTFFQWNTEQVGYWFSSIGVTRAIFLTVVLPFIIRRTAPAPPPIQLPVEPSEPLEHASSPATPTNAARPSISRSRSPSVVREHHGHHHSPAFDLALARVSLAIDATVYALLTVVPGGLVFAATSCLGALGMGFGPAIQSVALTLYNRRGGQDTGKLFGALSVVQAMSAQVFGPFVYGFTYAHTVATFPKAMIFMASGAVAISCILLVFVRLPSHAPADVEEQQLPGAPQAVEELPLGHPEREETLVDPLQPLIVIEDEDHGIEAVKP